MNGVIETGTAREEELTTLRRELEEAKATIVALRDLEKKLSSSLGTTIEQFEKFDDERRDALACCNAFLDAKVIDQRDKKGKATIASHISSIVMRVADHDHIKCLALKATGRDK